MTRILITGAAGFLGRRLTRALIQTGTAAVVGGPDPTITELCLADCVAFEPPSAPGVTVTVRNGDLADPTFVDVLASDGFDSLFHLASQLTLHAEQNPSRAYATNVEALHRLVNGVQGRPKVVFTSSLAVFGGDITSNRER
jgi:nucleoside-diphosphate-sugar epimerase